MKYKLLVICALMLLSSCSTTRLLSEGEYRLASNEVEVSGDKKIKSNDLYPYIRQSANKYFIFGWNPLLNVYNWSDGSGRGLNGVWEKVGVAPVVFNPILVQSTKDNMLGHLDYLGYYNARVEPEIMLKNKLAKVSYKVETGKRYPIDEIIYELPAGGFEDEFMADSLNISVRQGDFLSEQALEEEAERGASYFRNLGYYDINKNSYSFEADTLSGSTRLYYRIAGEPVKYTIKDVNITYPKRIKFNENLLRQFNTIKPGDYYSEELVNKSYYRFSALNLFSGVNIEMVPVDSAKVNCDISLTGSNIMGFKANLEASTNSSSLIGVSPQLSFFHKNIFHGGERLNIDFTGNWQFQPGTDLRATELGVTANLTIPQLLGVPVERFKGKHIPMTEIRASYNYHNRPEYRRSLASFSYGYSGRFSDKLFFQFYPFQLGLVKMYDMSEDFIDTIEDNPYLWDTFNDHLDLGVGSMLYYTSDAAVVPKSDYHFVRFSLDLSGNFLSLFDTYLPKNDVLGDQHTLLGVPYNQYVRTQLSMGKTFRFGRDEDQALAMRLDMGIGKAYGNSYALPFEKQFYGGGASSMRGWQVRTLGPGYSELDDYFIIPSQTGDVKFEFDMEYRFKMFWKLEGALFAEAGNVWQLKDLTDFKELIPGSIAADWGAGVRVNLDFILLRLDAGFKLHDPSRDAASRWLKPAEWLQRDGFAIHFGVGYPF